MSAAALARAAARTSWGQAPEPVRDRVVDLAADCVAVTALGSARTELRRLVAAHAASADAGSVGGRATVVGHAGTWPALDAAFLNASAAAADQLQDGHRAARGHPASHVVPAVLAVAEERDLDGPEVLSALLAGYETGTRVGRALGGTPTGVHDIGSWGQVAAAVGVARLLAPGDEARVGAALELSASAVLLTDASTVFAGRSGGHAFLGASVQLGTTLARAALAGLVPQPGALDRHLAAVAARDWDPARLIAGVSRDGDWESYEVLEGYVKAHPTCAHLHGVGDAVQDLLQEGLRAADVAEVEVRGSAALLPFAAVADDELAARFSVPTSVAVALLHGRLDETTLTAATVASATVRELAARVRVAHDPDLDAGYPDGRPARVVVGLTDGTARTAHAGRPRGDADRAFSREQLADKAERLLRSRFGDAGVDVLRAVHGLALGARARDLGQVLRTAAGARP